MLRTHKSKRRPPDEGADVSGSAADGIAETQAKSVTKTNLPSAAQDPCALPAFRIGVFHHVLHCAVVSGMQGFAS